MSHNAPTISIKLVRNELNQYRDVKTISPARIHSVVFANLFCVNQIYNNKFQNIAEPIYHHINISECIHHAVVAYQLQSVLIWIHSILHQEIIAINQCPNSCKNVTNNVTGYKIYSPKGIIYFNKK